MWLFRVYRETPECTFMEVYDVRWVTNFDEKMAEMNGNIKKKGEYKLHFIYNTIYKITY